MLLLLISLGAWSAAATAQAETTCEVSMASVFAGYAGVIWLTFADGSSAEVPLSNPSQTAILSLAVSAHLAGRRVAIRYSDGVCEGHHANVTGLFLK
ncbi:MAG: hypothetical protein J7521_01020 [Caulobacter sp.]|nr:hypothetical protein [Caulobacter sp.]